jgi:hypothetical protein
VIFIPGAFFWIHLHWAGVSATLLSAGIFPSRIKPILVILPVYHFELGKVAL